MKSAKSLTIPILKNMKISSITTIPSGRKNTDFLNILRILPCGCARAAIIARARDIYGRVGIHEIITATAAVKKAIKQSPDVDDLTQIALQEGMRTLRMDGVTKILQGITDYEQVSRVCL